MKRSRFPCEQYLDMGKSVLTPEEILLGKLVRRGVYSVAIQIGEKGIRPKFRNLFVGN